MEQLEHGEGTPGKLPGTFVPRRPTRDAMWRPNYSAGLPAYRLRQTFGDIMDRYGAG